MSTSYSDLKTIQQYLIGLMIMKMHHWQFTLVLFVITLLTSELLVVD